jgi:phosphatidylinositol alpha-mannosyltransferase
VRIAQVCPYDIDRPGGVQKHIRDTATALQALGHDVVIVAPRAGTGDDAPAHLPGTGIEIFRLGRAKKIGFGGTSYEISVASREELRDLERFLAGKACDIMHFHTMWTPVLSYQIFRRSKSVNIGTFHDTPAATGTGRVLFRLFRLMSRILLPRLDAVTTVSDAPLAHLSAAKNTRIHIFPPATDLRRFSEAGPGKRKFADGKVNILFLGRIDRRKGAMLLMEAYRGLTHEKLPVRLLIAGKGDDAELLKAYASANGLPDVEFLGGFADEEAPSIYAECDIFCAPSPYGESFGVVVAEAMASGKPVVAAANKGYRTLLKGKAARFLTPPGEAEAIRAALKELVLDEALRSELGEWGRAEAAQYDSAAVAPKFVALYEEALASRAGH